MPPVPLTGHLIDLVGAPTAHGVQSQELDTKLPLRGSRKPGEAAAPRDPRPPPLGEQSQQPAWGPQAAPRKAPSLLPSEDGDVAHLSGVTRSPALPDTAGLEAQAARARPGWGQKKDLQRQEKCERGEKMAPALLGFQVLSDKVFSNTFLEI